MNASGIMLASVAKSWPESHAELGSESNGKSSSLANTGMSTVFANCPMIITEKKVFKKEFSVTQHEKD